MAKTPVGELSDVELSNLWRTEQVLHAVARVMRQEDLNGATLGFPYLAVCQCAEGVQALAGRIQREKTSGNAQVRTCTCCTCTDVENIGST